MALQLSLTVLGHSCVLLEAQADGADVVSILLDPGSMTPPLEPIDDLDAVLITHAHPDHVDVEQVRRLMQGADPVVYSDEGTARLLAEAGLDVVTPVGAGVIDVAGIPVDVSTWNHETIYPGIPLPADLGFFIADTVFAPGDAFAIPDRPVGVLLLPTGAPWMKLADTIDYMRAVSPRVVVPVHDAGLAPAHRELHRNLMGKFAPEGCTVLRPEPGERIDLSALL